MKKGMLVKQRDGTDCGAACLASVSAFYGLRIPVSRIRQQAGTDKAGTSLYGLLQAALHLRFQAKGVKAASEHVRDIPLPAIFHTIRECGMQHFVVVYRISRRRVRYMDPASGRMLNSSLAIFQGTWSGTALLLLPADGFERGDQQVSVLKRFGLLIRPHRGLLLKALMGALVYTLLGLAMSVYVQKTIDLVLPEANGGLMNLLGLMMLVVLAGQVVVGFFKSLLILHTGQQIDAQLILGYYRHLLRLPQTFFDSMRVGEIISRINDAVKIRTFINDTALFLIVQLLTLVFSLAAIFLYSWKLSLILLSGIPVYLVLYGISNRTNAKWQRRIMESGATLESQLVESIQGIATIRKLGVAGYFEEQTERKLIPLLRALYKSTRAGLSLAQITELNTRLIVIFILWAGSYWVMQGDLSPGALLSCYTLAGFFTTPVQALIGANKMMQEALVAADRLFEIIDLQTESENSSGLPMASLPAGNLEFRNVHFSYAAGDPIFSGLHLTIERKGITAIIGASGSGKSTIFCLLQKLYSLQQGTIKIGDTDICYLEEHLLRRNISPVPQQTDLFRGTIASNIALGEEEPDMNRILDLCQRLGLHDFIDALPGRYQAAVREHGINLSGGQQQRLSIARALYRDPEILILDEATASLDPESEQKVLDTLHWFHGRGKTVIIIAHRLSTVRSCHRVIQLGNGRLLASGTHEQLIRENREYARWWGVDWKFGNLTASN